MYDSFAVTSEPLCVKSEVITQPNANEAIVHEINVPSDETVDLSDAAQNMTGPPQISKQENNTPKWPVRALWKQTSLVWILALLQHYHDTVFESVCVWL